MSHENVPDELARYTSLSEATPPQPSPSEGEGRPCTTRVQDNALYLIGTGEGSPSQDGKGEGAAPEHSWQNPSVSDEMHKKSSSLEGRGKGEGERGQSLSYRLEFVGANPTEPQARNAQEGRVKYFIGNDPSKWHTDIPIYQEIVYPGLYGRSGARGQGLEDRGQEIEDRRQGTGERADVGATRRVAQYTEETGGMIDAGASALSKGVACDLVSHENVPDELARYTSLSEATPPQPSPSQGEGREGSVPQQGNEIASPPSGVRNDAVEDTPLTPLGRGEVIPLNPPLEKGEVTKTDRPEGLSLRPDVEGQIDLVYKGVQGGMKYEFIVHPGANPDEIRLAYTGIEGLSIDESGNLIISTALGDVKDEKSYAYQDIDGERVEVIANFFWSPATMSLGRCRGRATLTQSMSRQRRTRLGEDSKNTSMAFLWPPTTPATPL